MEEEQDPQSKWEKIVTTCTEIVEEVMGQKDIKKKSQSQEIKRLSQEQKQIRIDKPAKTKKQDKN